MKRASALGILNMYQNLIWLISTISTIGNRNAIATTISTHVTSRQEDGFKGDSTNPTGGRSWSGRRNYLRFTARWRTVQQRTLCIGSYTDNRNANRQDRRTIIPRSESC